MLESVINISEGRDRAVLEILAEAAGEALLDVHSDPHHHRSVFTLAGPDVAEAARSLASAAVQHLRITDHQGVHPRIGVVDVVPFVPLAGSDMGAALSARDDFARWIGGKWGIPAYIYGPERTLPEVRRLASTVADPDYGSVAMHSTAGACAVGARPELVAYNLWLRHSTLGDARRIARAIRRPGLRTLGLAVGNDVQVSCNLTEPAHLGPQAAYDLVSRHSQIDRAELVGLISRNVLANQDRLNWSKLNLSEEKTIEARLEERGLK